MLEGPVPATKAVLARAGLSVEDLDLVEVNEAFSSVPLAWARAMTGGGLSKVNVNGGAIARGHPPVAAFNYAQEKTSKSITISLATLEGAAYMNNPFWFAMFFALIYA